MRWLSLYLRSRRAPVALLVVAVSMAVLWSLWSVFSSSRAVAVQMVELSVLLLVAALTATLGGPDDALEGTAAMPWPPRRAAHLAVAFLVVVAMLSVTLTTGARFGPAGLVIRDAAGLLGLTALAAAAMGPSRAWFVPLGWTLAAILFPRDEPVLGRVLTWQSQAPADHAAAITGGVLALSGLIAYAVAGPARQAPAEAAQQ